MASPRPPKIAVLGIGSVIFGVDLLRDLFQTPELRGCRLALVDIKEEKLAPMAALAQRLNEASGWGVGIEATTDRAAALPGADFVVTAIAVKRDELWKLDHQLCLKHGFPSVLSENGGPGGLSHALRAIPPMLEIARDMERLCPQALLLNYTNPEGRICLAVRRHTQVRAVGLCHGVAGTIPWMAGLLGRKPEDLDVHAAGVNHFTWVTSLRDAATGEDLYPQFRCRLAEEPPDVRPLCRLLLDRFGLFPTTGDTHVGEYIGWAAEIVGTRGYDFERLAGWREALTRNLEAWSCGAQPVEPLQKEPSRERALGLSALGVAADILARRMARKPSLILPNEGCIENVDAGGVVEVPGLVEGGQPKGVPVGALPVGLAAMVQREIEIQTLAVDAAVSGSRELALQALLIDPVVHSARAAEAFLDEVLTVHKPYLPTFQ